MADKWSAHEARLRGSCTVRTSVEEAAAGATKSFGLSQNKSALRGFNHCENVFERRAGLNVVARAANITRSVGTQGVKAIPNFATDVFRRSAW